MKITHLILLAATAHAYQGEWCDECTTIVDTFDALDANTIADQICPLIGYETICEDIAPYMIDWIQNHADAKTVCADWCATGEDYDTYGDYDEIAYLHVAQDLHHHPFDVPHPEPTEDPPANLTDAEDLHVAHDLHHHPFDVPHQEEGN